jgi:hypothetical protein
MAQEIAFSGLSHQPSDYDSPDGALSVAINLIPEEGALRPVPSPVVKLYTGSTYGRGDRPVATHTTATYTHIILRSFNDETNGLRFFFIDEDDIPQDGGVTEEQLTPITSLFGAMDEQEADTLTYKAIGNILLLFSSTRTHYLYWRDNAYDYLGTRLPDPKLSFGLYLDGVASKKFKISQSFTQGSDGDDNDVLAYCKEEDRSALTQTVLASVNRLVNERATGKGRFAFPFFVRYAVRLYDDSYIMQSAPVLMNPTTGEAPYVTLQTYGCTAKVDAATGKTVYTTVDKLAYMGSSLSSFLDNIKDEKVRAFLVRGQLNYKHTPDADDASWADIVERWRDIAVSVDIFVSAPIYTYDQSGTVSAVKAYGYERNLELANDGKAPWHVGDVTDAATGTPSGKEKYQLVSGIRFKNVEDMDNDDAAERYFTVSYDGWRIALPGYDGDELKEKHTSASTFYLLKSIPIEELVTGERTAVEVNDDYLQSLLVKRTLEDDYDSHDTLIPSTAYVYNSRLNLAGLVKHRRTRFDATLFQQCLTDIVYDSQSYASAAGLDYNTRVAVRLLVEGKSYYVDGGSSENIHTSTVRWFYYPDAAAKEVFLITRDVVRDEDGNVVYTDQTDTSSGRPVLIPQTKEYVRSFKLTAHDFLNGAYAYLPDIEESDAAAPVPDTLIATPILNKIYTSEVNNPFSFPVTGINTVGTGTVKALASLTEAVSEGQFGQYAVYAFTDEGVWAMQVSTATGGFSSASPVSRDIITGAVCQSDGAVFFPTERGVMKLSGSSVQCISDVLFADTPVEFAPYKGLVTLAGMERTAALRDYLKGAQLAFDYVHQRLLLFNYDFDYAYLYSLKSQQWGGVRWRMQGTLEGYPECLVTDGEGRLYDLTRTGDEYPDQFLLTRPVKLGDGGVLKTVSRLYLRGLLPLRGTGVALYASRNLFDWHLLSSSNLARIARTGGTPFKYFTVAVTCALKRGMALTGLSVEAEARYGNKLR